MRRLLSWKFVNVICLARYAGRERVVHIGLEDLDMSRRLYVSLAIAAVIVGTAQAQQPPAPAPQAGRGAAPRVTRPALFFSEQWKQTPANDEHPMTQ